MQETLLLETQDFCPHVGCLESTLERLPLLESGLVCHSVGACARKPLAFLLQLLFLHRAVLLATLTDEERSRRPRVQVSRSRCEIGVTELEQELPPDLHLKS